MTQPHPTEARFPLVPPPNGHYESFYLKACHPTEPLGVWIRYTVHKRQDADANGSVWFTLFDHDGGGPRAEKVTLPGPVVAGGDWLRVGESRIGDGLASGSAGDAIEWELRFGSDESPLFHLPKPWMYGAKLPKTKLLSPVPAARFEGRLGVDGREIAVEGWRGMVGHNWGSQHAERWIWLHGLDDAGDWIDAAIGKVKIGPFTTPWVGNGAVCVDGERLALGGPGKKVEVDEAPDRCRFAIAGKGVRVRGEVSAPRDDFVGWVYADPDGPEHHTVNCSIADLALTVERDGREKRELRVAGGAAYELGMRERDHGMTIQPFPDG